MRRSTITNTTQSYAERVTTSKTELTEAAEAVPLAENALNNARDAVAAMRQGRRAGDTSIDAEGLAVARARVDLCGDDLTYAQTRLKAAQRNLLNDDKSVSDLLAVALRGLARFDGFNVESTLEAPAMPTTIDRPTLYLVQTVAPDRNLISGRSAATVDAYLHRPSWGTSLDVGDVDEILSKQAIYADVTRLGTRKNGEVCEDRARFGVRGIWPEIPVIGKLNGANRFGQILAGRVASALSEGRRGALAQSPDGGIGSSARYRDAVSGKGDATIVKDSASKGKRRAVVEATMTLRSQTLGTGIIGPGAMEFLKELPGQYEEGLGRIESVEFLPTPDAGKRFDPPTHINARFIFVSATP